MTPRNRRRLFFALPSLAIPLLLIGGTLTYSHVNWADGNTYTAADHNTERSDIKTAVDGNATDIATLQGQMATALGYIGYIQAPNVLVGTFDPVAFPNGIPAGTTPGGELGGTWASPTIDDNLGVSGWTLTNTTLAGTLTVPNDAIALGTNTTGNYVGTVTGDAEIQVAGADAENATKTLSIASSITRDSELATVTISANAASGNCNPRDIWFRTGSLNIYVCTASNTWTTFQ